MEVFFIILLILLFLGLIWLIIGILNYASFVRIIENYQEAYNKLKEQEQQYTDVSVKADIFLKRMTLEKEHPLTFSFMEEYEERKEAFLREAVQSFLLIGPIYWFTKKN